MNNCKKTYRAPEIQDLQTVAEQLFATSGSLEGYDELVDYELS